MSPDTALRGTQGEITGYLAIHRDVTERRRKMDELRESQQQTETILESTADDSRSAGRGRGAAAGEHPRQSVDNELLLAARDGPGPARDRLVAAFLPGIEQLAREVWTAGQRPPSQLIEQGVAGLLRALDRYDSTLDTPFWAYASWWVRQAMRYARGE